MGSERDLWRKLDAEATPGPWRHEWSDMCRNVVEADDDEQAVASTWAPSSLPEDDYTRETNNAAFIAAARIGWPAAEAEVEQLRALLRQVRDELDADGWTNGTEAEDALKVIDQSGLLGGSDG